MPYPLPLTRTEAYLAYKAGVIQQSDLKPSLAVPRNGIDAWLAYWTGLAEDYPKREDGTPHILQEEEAYIAYLCGVTDTYPEECLRRVGAYLRYIISARWGRPDHPLNREELYLSLIKTQFIPSGDPSSDIVIDGTAKAPFVDVKMYGDTFQQSYDGKNLIDMPIVSDSKNGITWVVNDDGSITLNGTATAIVNIRANGVTIPAVAGETYTLSATGLQGIINFGYKNSRTGADIFIVTNSSPVKTEQITSEMLSSADRLDMFIAGGNTFDNQRVTLQLEKGSSASDFEPFVGGVPSPSPSYPQQIQTVTGEQKVTVVGKNMFDKTNSPSMLFGANASQIETGLRIIQETAGQWKGCIFVLGKASDVAGQTINVHAVATKSASNKPLCQISLCDSTGGDRVLVKNSDNLEIDITATMPSSPSREYYCLTLNSNGDGTGSIGDYIDYKELMVYLGSADTTYAPYSKRILTLNLGSIELCKLGTYQDYIYKSGSDWKVHKTIKKLQMADTTSWDKYVNGKFYSQGWAADNGVSKEAGLCSHFIYSTPAWNGVDRYGISSSGNLWVSTSVTTLIDRDSFNAWIGTKQPVMLQPLATPTDTAITDTTLIAQLEALVNGGAENGTTYIKVNATDPNLPAKLYVEAPKYE